MIREVFIVSALLAAGCGKQGKTTSEKGEATTRAEATAGAMKSQLAPEQAAQIEAQFLPPANPSSASRTSPAIEDRLNGAVHAQLTAQLRMFKALKGRMPENFYELANTVGDSAPRLPDGMKFVIDPADQTVKAVRK